MAQAVGLAREQDELTVQPVLFACIRFRLARSWFVFHSETPKTGVPQLKM